MCLSILSGSIGAVFGRRYGGCETVVRPDYGSSSSLGAANLELLRPANSESSGDVMVREAASTAGDVDTESASGIAELEAENTALRERVKQLEACRPTTEGELAVLAQVEPQKLQAMMDQRLFPDAAVLAETMRVTGWQNTWAAIQIAHDLRWDLVRWLQANGAPPVTAEWAERSAAPLGVVATSVRFDHRSLRASLPTALALVGRRALPRASGGEPVTPERVGFPLQRPRRGTPSAV